MRIVIGSDHAGFDQKESIKRHIAEQGYDVVDVGTSNSDDSVDYPDFAAGVGRMVAAGEADRGILVCGTGIGMAMAANKVHGVRAANVTLPAFARLAREHNDANVLTVSGRLVSEDVNTEIIDVFLGTEFEGGRHARRIAKIAELEKK